MTRKVAAVTANSRRNIAREIRTTIRVCNVPEPIKRALISKAAAEGASLSAYLRAELEALAALPSEAQVRARLEDAKRFGVRASSARIIRMARTERAETIRTLKRRYRGSAADIDAMISIAEEALPPDHGNFDVRTWFSSWIRMPQPCLGGQAPEHLLGTPDGRKQIRRLVGALASGAYL